MKVLYQEWKCGREWLWTISKDTEQYEETAKHLEGDAVPDDEKPREAEIPDDHEFAFMIHEGTIFLHPEERDAITIL